MQNARSTIHFARQAVVLAATLTSVLLTTGRAKHLAAIVTEHRIQTMQVPREHPTEMHFLVQLPRGYNDETNRLWPLVFYLHGIGESGHDLEKVLRFDPPKIMAEGRDLPAISFGLA